MGKAYTLIRAWYNACAARSSRTGAGTTALSMGDALRSSTLAFGALFFWAARAENLAYFVPHALVSGGGLWAVTALPSAFKSPVTDTPVFYAQVRTALYFGLGYERSVHTGLWGLATLPQKYMTC